MATKTPNPKDTFNAYIDVQDDMDVQLRKLLQRVSKEIEKDIIKASGPNVSAAVERDQLRMVKKSLNERISALYKAEGNVVQAGKFAAAAAAQKVFEEYEYMLYKTGLPSIDLNRLLTSSKATSKAGIEAALKRLEGKSYQPLSRKVYQTEQLSKGLVDRYVEAALVKGLSAKQLAKGVRDMLNPNVKGGVSYASMRLGRTEINNAFHAISAEKYEESPYVTGVEWHLSGSHPEGDECDDLADESPYPKDDVPEKPHPQCFCFITPEMMSEDEFLDHVFSDDADDEVKEAVADHNNVVLDERFKETDWVDMPQAILPTDLEPGKYGQNDAELDSLIGYLSNDYHRINNDLWAGRQNTDADNLNRMLRRTKAPTDMVVTRGTNYAKDASMRQMFDSLKIGDVYEAKGITSTSTAIVNKHRWDVVSREVWDGNDGGLTTTDVQFRMGIPKGSFGAAVNAGDPDVPEDGEAEWLMPSGGRYVVSNVYDKTIDVLVKGKNTKKIQKIIEMVLVKQ